MAYFRVNPQVANIFKRILESWNSTKSGKRFAKSGGRKICGSAVNLVRINHTAPALTCTAAAYDRHAPRPCRDAGQSRRFRPIAGLRAAGGSVSYRQFSAPHKLAFQAGGIARVYALPPWNRLDLEPSVSDRFSISNAKYNSPLH